MDIETLDLKTVTIWVELWGLDFKYWGDRSLGKIAGRLGAMIKPDNATKNRERLQYARVMIETSVDHSFPLEISFNNEKQVVTRVEVKYTRRLFVGGRMVYQKNGGQRNKQKQTKTGEAECSSG